MENFVLNSNLGNLILATDIIFTGLMLVVAIGALFVMKNFNRLMVMILIALAFGWTGLVLPAFYVTVVNKRLIGHDLDTKLNMYKKGTKEVVGSFECFKSTKECIDQYNGKK